MRRAFTAFAVTAMLFGVSAGIEASPIVYNAILLGANENPTVPSPGSGIAQVIVDAAAHTLSVDVYFTGLIGNTTASHIHCCQVPPTNAQVATTTPTFAGFPLGVTSGSYFRVLDTTLASSYNPAFVTAHGANLLQAEADLFAGIAAGQAYLNIHTLSFPGGEIRGTLLPGPAVPEPTSVLLLGSGLAGAAVRRWRRRRV